MAERQRLLELALKGLESEQNRIQDEIRAIRSELGVGSASRLSVSVAGRPARVAPNKGKPMSAAQKRKISAAMKRRHAERRRLAKAAGKSGITSGQRSPGFFKIVVAYTLRKGAQR